MKKYARTFAIAASLLALGAISSTAEARGGGHGGGAGGGSDWGLALASAAVRGIAEGLTASAATPVYGSNYAYTSSYTYGPSYSPIYGYGPPAAPPPVYYPTVVSSSPGVSSPAYVVMPASAGPYLAMGVKLTPELIYGLTGANAVAPVFQPYYVPTPQRPVPAVYRPSWTVNVH